MPDPMTNVGRSRRSFAAVRSPPFSRNGVTHGAIAMTRAGNPVPPSCFGHVTIASAPASCSFLDPGILPTNQPLVACVTQQPAEVTLAILVSVLTLVRLVVADDTPSCSTRGAVTGHVPRDAAN